MQALLKQFEETAPEIVFEWKDRLSEAEGWLVINSLRGGAAGGGTRMRKGLNRNEVTSLAKTMEIKFTVSGPAIGGAKSGINFDPNDPRKVEVLERWYKAVTPILKNYYGTGGDMNVDEIHDVIPITEGYGLWHPQEGIVKGHYEPTERAKINKIGQLRAGVSKIIEDPNYVPDKTVKFTVSDMITGYGVAVSVKHFYQIWHKDSIREKKVIIQGWGNVGAAAGFFLAQMGVKIVGIIDGGGGVIKEEGFSFQEVKELFMNRKNRLLYRDDMISFEEANERIWDLKAEICIPAAGSRLINEDQLDRMVAAGLKLISSGANVPFNDPEIFYGQILSKADDSLSVIPDFIANCGMARVFAYLMGSNVEITDKAIFNDVSNVIREALMKVYDLDDSLTDITSKALEIAVNQLIIKEV
ncbi:MAG: Glu/Leu/Phe/Val dehydrogenase dimerization domain-containing protein [Chitinophagales bacterium]